MKRILLVVSAVAASLLINAAAVLAAGDYLQAVSPPQGAQQRGGLLEAVSPPLGAQKDECLLVARNCSDEVLSLQERVDKLNLEISKGTDVYTVDELNVLRRKLDDANKTMELIRFDRY